MYKLYLLLSAIILNYTPTVVDIYWKNQLLTAQSQYCLDTSYIIRCNKYDRKNIPVYCFCKKEKTLETSETITIFVHGYRDTYRQAYSYIKNPQYHNDILTSDCLVTFDFADKGKALMSWDLTKTSLAQENEMYQLHVVLKSIKKRAKHAKKIILYGVSRGASVILTTMSHYAHPEVSALILESPFAQFKDVVDNCIDTPIVRALPFIKNISMPLACLIIPAHKAQGISPIKVIQKLPKDLPMLIVATTKDRLIPYTSSVMLYTTLVNNGFPNVHFNLLHYGRHARLALHEQALTFEKTVHDFYEKYNFS